MGKFIAFFIEVKAELLKVVWPSRNDTIKYTIIVIGFSILLAAILGAADLGLAQLLTKFINR